MALDSLDHLLDQREVLLHQIMRNQWEKQPFFGDQLASCPLVSIITATNKPDYMEHIFANFAHQSYPNTELIVILNNNQLMAGDWREYSRSFPETRIMQLDESCTLGECLNYAIDQARGEYIAKFDDDDYYLPHYLRDAIYAFEYSQAGVVGKNAHFVYFTGSGQLAYSTKGSGYHYHQNLAGGTHVIRKQVWEKIPFAEVNSGEDRAFNHACVQRGIRLYAIDPFNYLRVRHPDKSRHTWKIADQEFLNACLYLTTTDHPLPLVER